MKSVSLKDLKKHLSEVTEQAARGEVVQVTKYNKPFVVLMGVASPAVHVGSKVGTTSLVSIGKKLTRGRFLSALKEDREDE